MKLLLPGFPGIFFWESRDFPLPGEKNSGRNANPRNNTKVKELPFKKLKELDVKHFDTKEKQSHLKIHDCSVDFVDSMISRLEGASISNPSVVKKKTEVNLRKANKALLGKLFDDQVIFIFCIVHVVSGKLICISTIAVLDTIA